MPKSMQARYKSECNIQSLIHLILVCSVEQKKGVQMGFCLHVVTLKLKFIRIRKMLHAEDTHTESRGEYTQ